MPEYRVYTIGDDGHIAGPPDIIDCPDDQAAIREAKRSINGKAVELWDGARFVSLIDPLPRLLRSY